MKNICLDKICTDTYSCSLGILKAEIYNTQNKYDNKSPINQCVS